MDIGLLKHDPEKALQSIKRVPVGDDDFSIVATKPVRVIMPKHWMESDLGSIDERFNSFCFIGVIDANDNYGSFQAITSISLNPYDISVAKIEDADYYILSYQAGETITDSLRLVKDNVKTYGMFNEFHAKAKTPFYMSYPDVTLSFRTSIAHAGFNPNANMAVLSITTANRARDPKDMSRPIRYAFKTQEDVINMKPVYVPLTSVSGATSTSARLMGNYQADAVVESIVNPSDTLEEADTVMFI